MGKKILSRETLAPIVNDIIGDYDIKLTVRQIYYRLVTKNVIPNTRSYYNSFDNILTRIREDGLVLWSAIEDRSRETIGGDISWEESPQRFLEGELDALKECWRRYSLPLWTSQESYIEIWIEKDALSTLASHVCNRYRVLLFPCRGYSSGTKLVEAVSRLPDHSVILYFGDHDPSGLQMQIDLKKRLRRYGSDMVMEPIALTKEQIDEYGLSPNPVKKADTRSPEYIAKYGEECWELDALPPDVLQKIIDKTIREHIDWEAWEKRQAEIGDGKVKVQEMIKKVIASLDENHFGKE